MPVHTFQKTTTCTTARRQWIRPAFCSLAFVAVLALTGCAPRERIEPLRDQTADTGAASLRATAELIKSDPVAYLHQVYDRCCELDQYTVDFTRQERRGLGPFKRLYDPEHIECKFRREPFSIYFKWTDPEIKHNEATYVAGQEDDKVRFVPRYGFLGLEPRLTKVELMTPVIWGEARYPVTDFGVQRMLERTFASLERAGDQVEFSYEGISRLTGYEHPVHYLVMKFPQSMFATPTQELYIDVATGLPACTRVLRPDGSMEGAYIWANINPDVHLTDEDFLLEPEREAQAAEKAEQADETDSSSTE